MVAPYRPADGLSANAATLSGVATQSHENRLEGGIEMSRWRWSWVVLAVVWMAIATGARALFTALGLYDGWGYIALVPVVLLLGYTARRILAWGSAP